ncbi:MAG TPA: beta-propeller fold lactonase family protein [Solirubrobacteraceae bacterium]|nr:beta-propeller fold lactonase family protein [Solirubrobacteraceae bacterium]
MRIFARLLTRKWLSTVLLGSIGAAAAVVPATASAAPHASPIVGHVYVNDNTAGTNTIGAFNRHADGSLTPEAGSPFNAGGAGNASGLASQGAIQITGNGRYVLAVDAGSNQISVLKTNFDGSLSRESVVSSGGQLPVSVAVHHDLVYVANASPTSPNYTGFTLHHGQLTPLAGSTVVLSNGAQPADVLFNGDGRKLVGTEAGSGEIDSFTVGHDRRLTPAPGSPFPAQGVGPFGSEFSPANPNQLFVSNAHNDVAAGTTGHGTVSAFDDSPNGVLSSIGSSPFADLQTAPCWVEITDNGRFLFTVNTGSGEISRYSIASTGALTLLGSTPVRATGGVGAVDARLSPDGRTLYVDESTTGKVGEFAVNGGNLTALVGSPVSLPNTGTAGIATD